MKSIAEILQSYAVFDADGKHVNGCDKMSNHNYGAAYELLFPGNGLVGREGVKLVMEVGVADGSCLHAWRDAFPNALVVGMDIHHSDKAHGERIEFHLGDQRSQQDCENVAAGCLFDLIIEDATHQIENTLLTLLYLWPFVRPGGLYVIEEFANVGALRGNIAALWPGAQVLDTVGPFGGVEPLVVFRKPL